MVRIIAGKPALTINAWAVEKTAVAAFGVAYTLSPTDSSVEGRMPPPC